MNYLEKCFRLYLEESIIRFFHVHSFVIIEIYYEKKEIKATALELFLPPNKVKKLLLTGNIPTYPETEQIQELMSQGKTITEIQETMDLSYSALHTYLPYTKVIYKMSEISQNVGGIGHKLQAEEGRCGNTYGSANRRSSVELYCRIPAVSVPYRYWPSIFLHTEDGKKWGIHQRTFH